MHRLTVTHAIFEGIPGDGYAFAIDSSAGSSLREALQTVGGTEAVEGEAVEPVLHLHGLEERGGHVKMTTRHVSMPEPALEVPEPEVAAGDERAHAESPGQREGCAEVVPPDLDARRLVFGGDESEEPVRVHLVASLSALERKPERSFPLPGGLHAPAGNEVGLAQVGDDERQAPEPAHALRLCRRPLAELDARGGASG